MAVPSVLARQAARDFLYHKDKLGNWRRGDLLMGLGRLYEFPPATPPPPDKMTVKAISAYIVEHAVPIE